MKIQLQDNDGFVKLWNTYGQFGQFVDVHTGEICVGGSASAAIAPAGLAQAYCYFNHPEYLRVAEESAEKVLSGRSPSWLYNRRSR